MNKVIFTGLAMAFLAACSPSIPNTTAMTTNARQAGIVEVTTFQLRAGVETKDFEAAARAIQKGFLALQTGFLKRTLTVSQDGTWTDIVYWEDQESAEKAMQMAEQSELVMPFMEKIDFNSVKMNLTTPILSAE
jgi:hypothetical protein